MPTTDGLFRSSDFCDGSVITRVIADESVISLKLASSIQSDNYVAELAGWKIERDTGNAEFNDITVRGDIVAANWDGGSDLSGGKDTGATAGFFLDSSAGAAQFQTIYAEGGELGDLDVTGDLTLTSTGTIKTAASGKRIEIASDSFNRLFFYSGEATETSPGTIEINAHTSGTISTATIRPPITSSETDPPSISLQSVSGARSIVLNGKDKVDVLSDLVVGNDQILASDIGTAAAPSIASLADTNTGIWFPGADTLGFSTAGTNRMTIDSGGAVIIPNEVQVGDGSATDPSFAFKDDGSVNTGFYRPGENQIGATAGGTLRFAITTTEIQARGDNGAHFFDYAPVSSGGGGIAAKWVNISGSIYRLDINSSTRASKIIDPRPRFDPNRIYDLEPITFAERSNPQGGHYWGIVADDADQHMPELVQRNSDGDIVSFDYERLVVPLLAAVQHLNHRVTQLEER